ncbi:rCG25737, partial [Rattus norvegicus]
MISIAEVIGKSTNDCQSREEKGDLNPWSSAFPLSGWFFFLSQDSLRTPAKTC